MSFTAKDFSREQIHQIAQAYSTGNYSYHNFIEEYGCSQHTFYSIINRAVVESIVSDEIMKAIELVAIANSTCKAGDLKPDKKFIKIVEDRVKHSNLCRRLKRLSYILPKKETISLIQQYIDSPDPKLKFCEQFYITPQLFGYTLKYAIIHSWITLKTVEQLRQKAYLFNERERVDKLFNACLALRKQCKR